MRKVRGFLAVGASMGVTLCALLVTSGLLAPAASAKTITLGSIGASPGGCNYGVSYVQRTTATTSPSYSAPSDGAITSWRSSSFAGGTSALKIWRPTSDPSQFTLVGESTIRTLPSGNKLTTFSTSIPVQKGDHIGVAVISGDLACYYSSANSGDVAASTSGDPSGTATFADVFGNNLLNLSATFKPDCVVPKLKGKTLAAAKKALKKHDCTLGTVTKKKSSGKAGIVLSQNPKPGTESPPGSKVAVVVSKL